MKNFGKRLAIWIIIGFLLVVLFNLHQSAQGFQGGQHAPIIVSFLISWWPMLLLLALALFILRQLLARRYRSASPRAGD